MPPMGTADSRAASRFAVACGVLSHYVKASNVARVMPAAPRHVGSFAQHCPRAQQLKIFYGGRVVVLDGCTPAWAAEVTRYAALASQGRGQWQVPLELALVDIPFARRLSLQRFLARRRKQRSSAADPPGEAPPAKKRKTVDSSWLSLGSLSHMHAQ